MADFPYSPNPASIRKFLEHIQRAGVPPKVTQQYLGSVGFKTKNDRYLLPVLKDVGFLDSSGAPTKLWQQFRNKDTAKSLLASAIRKTYEGLFTTYPDAHRKDNEALRNFFSSHTSVGGAVLDYMVRTFKTLSDLADFETAAPAAPGAVPSPTPPAPVPLPPLPAVAHTSTTGPAININIQLEIPATENADIYDKLFAALKKHLFS